MLYFLNGHVHGETVDDVVCSLPGNLLVARFFFDVTGDRVAESWLLVWQPAAW